jgi:hypothetical protein
MCNVLTVPTVWYFNCHRQCGIFLLFLQCGILIALTVWYFSCPQQYGIFLLFLECGILTFHDNVECSYCSDSVVL